MPICFLFIIQKYVSCSLLRKEFGRRLMSKTLRRVRNRIQLGSRFITPFARKRNAREHWGESCHKSRRIISTKSLIFFASILNFADMQLMLIVSFQGNGQDRRPKLIFTKWSAKIAFIAEFIALLLPSLMQISSIECNMSAVRRFEI